MGSPQSIVFMPRTYLQASISGSLLSSNMTAGWEDDTNTSFIVGGLLYTSYRQCPQQFDYLGPCSSKSLRAWYSRELPLSCRSSAIHLDLVLSGFWHASHRLLSYPQSATSPRKYADRNKAFPPKLGKSEWFVCPWWVTGPGTLSRRWLSGLLLTLSQKPYG